RSPDAPGLLPAGPCRWQCVGRRQPRRAAQRLPCRGSNAAAGRANDIHPEEFKTSGRDTRRNRALRRSVTLRRGRQLRTNFRDRGFGRPRTNPVRGPYLPDHEGPGGSAAWTPAFVSRNPPKATPPHSRPFPAFLYPPNGASGSSPAPFTKPPPASSRAATSLAL